MKLYEVTAHIFEDGKLVSAVRLELESGSLFLAHDDALVRLAKEYPGKTISVQAKELL